MKYGAVLLCVVTAVTAANAYSLYLGVVLEEWTAFKMEHRKFYEPTEDLTRIRIFALNRYKIAQHNQRYEQGLVSYKLGLNKYSDMVHSEFVRIMNGYKRGANNTLPSPLTTFVAPAHVTVPGQLDWRNLGAVTAVKDQGHCGSCWAFSATGALEGQHFRHSGYLVSLSEQNLLDCSGRYGNQGCNGGNPMRAFTYIKDNGGIDTENSYPYETSDGHQCRYNPQNSGASDLGYIALPGNDETALLTAVAAQGPVSVLIDAGQPDFMLYRQGVYYNPQCSSTELDHAVLVVGYGTDETGGDYWLVKNSWGESWGERGYIKMARNRGNNCGIASAASYPIV